MDNWFTVEKIDTDTFAISEYAHWEETHCYLLLGSDRAALIDTGLGVANIREAVEGLTPLPVTVLTTHAHWDHIGGHRYFPDFALHGAEAEWVTHRFPLPLEVVKKNLTCKPCDFPEAFRLEEYRLFRGTPRRLLTDGDRLDIGGRRLMVIHTPGHSPGHCCFYEPDRSYLYSGDLVYSGCLDAFYPTTDPQEFWRSVQKIQTLPVEKLLPAHHRLDIPPTLIPKIEEAFSYLAQNSLLTQGNGIFRFEDFQIHI